MRPAARIVVREAELLTLPSGADRRRVIRRLLDATAGHPFQVFTEERRGLRAGNVVGLVDAGSVCVEILPKTGAVGDAAGGDREATVFLLDLLSYAGLVPRTVSTTAHTQTAPRLLEVICSAAAHTIMERLVDGVPRQYVERRELASSLRGAPELGAIARRRPGGDSSLPIRHAPLHRDNHLTRLVSATASELAGRTRSAHTWSLLHSAMGLLDGARRVPLSLQLVEAVHLHRGEERWGDIVALARLLCAGQGPSPVSRGTLPGLSVLFPLHDLFESVLRRSLADALSGSHLEVARNAGKTPLLRSLVHHGDVLPLKPDFVFRNHASGAVTAIGDAKWKRLRQTEASHGASTSDLYQLATYLFRYDTPRGLLFFPVSPWMGSTGPAAWSHRYQLLGPGGGTVTFIGVDVAGLASRSRERRGNAIRTLSLAVLAGVS